MFCKKKKGCLVYFTYNTTEERLKEMVVIDFMAYARKVATKKMNLISYEDFFKVFWKTFSSFSIG